LTPIDGQLTKAKPRVYWASGGDKSIGLTLTIPGQPALSASGSVTINRKAVSVSTMTSSVDVYTRAAPPVGDGSTWIQFGRKGVANEVDGIDFIKGFSLGMPEGTFIWAQVIDDTSIQYYRTGGLTRRGFGGGLSDGGFPYSLDQHEAFDSPGTRLDPSPLAEVDGSPIDRAEYFATFSMYLMWHSAAPDAIFVPLTVVHWGVSEIARWDGTRWVEDLGTFTVSPFEDTTTYPSWSGMAPRDVTWIDGD
jgi:hypothetical protein